MLLEKDENVADRELALFTSWFKTTNTTIN